MTPEYIQNGYYMARHVFKEHDVKQFINALHSIDIESSAYGIRDLMNKVPYIREIAQSLPLLNIAQEILGQSARPVRSVYFDKNPHANWNVAWHQDTLIAVKQKAQLIHFNTWSEKQGIVHVEPPALYLDQMLTLRIHLDVTNTHTGVLRVIPGTHRQGRVSSSDILKTVEQSTVIECPAEPGDILLMNPLLFHSSRKATHPTHRRIIHLEYSVMDLPAPLEWFEAPPCPF